MVEQFWGSAPPPSTDLITLISWVMWAVFLVFTHFQHLILDSQLRFGDLHIQYTVLKICLNCQARWPTFLPSMPSCLDTVINSIFSIILTLSRSVEYSLDIIRDMQDSPHVDHFVAAFNPQFSVFLSPIPHSSAFVVNALSFDGQPYMELVFSPFAPLPLLLSHDSAIDVNANFHASH